MWVYALHAKTMQYSHENSTAVGHCLKKVTAAEVFLTKTWLSVLTARFKEFSPTNIRLIYCSIWTRCLCYLLNRLRICNTTKSYTQRNKIRHWEQIMWMHQFRFFDASEFKDRKWLSTHIFKGIGFPHWWEHQPHECGLANFITKLLDMSLQVYVVLGRSEPVSALITEACLLRLPCSTSLQGLCLFHMMKEQNFQE